MTIITPNRVTNITTHCQRRKTNVTKRMEQLLVAMHLESITLFLEKDPSEDGDKDRE